MTAFLALDPSDEVRARVAEAIARERATIDAKWVSRENLHVTLAFVGPLAPERWVGLIARARTVASMHRPFAVELSGGDTFGGRILWLGVEGDRASLNRLALELTAALEVTPDHATYTPHLTLARAIRAKGDGMLDEAARRLKSAHFGQWLATHFTVYESQAGRYVARARIPLGNPEVSKDS